MDAFPELLKHHNLITGADTNLQLIKDTIETIRTTVILEEIPEELLNHDTLILKHAVIFEGNLTAELISIIVNDICCPLFPCLYKLSKSIGANILALYKKCMEQHPPEEENYMIRMLSRSISVYIHEGVMNTADNNANSKHESECINIDTVLDIILVYPQICISEYTSNLDLTINNKALPMATHPKVLGLTLDPKLTYRTHIHNISVQAHTPLQIIKAFTATGWGKKKETLMATYKAVMRPALEYASSVWSPIASSTSINKLQVMQNAALRTATGCTQDTNTHTPHTRAPTAPRVTIQTENTTSITSPTQTHNVLQHYKAKKTLFLTTAATQQTFPQTPTQSLQQT